MQISGSNPLWEPMWERQKYETRRMFVCFKLYRDLPYGAKDPLTGKTAKLTTRSHVKVAHRLGVSTQYINRLSRQWSWVQRVTAWDKKIEAEEKSKVVKQYYPTRKELLKFLAIGMLISLPG